MQRWAIDSIEESVASVEVDGKKMMQVPQGLLPGGAKEGDVLSVRQTSSPDGEKSLVEIAIDRAETRRALDASAAQVQKGAGHAGPKKDPGGDIRF